MQETYEKYIQLNKVKEFAEAPDFKSYLQENLKKNKIIIKDREYNILKYDIKAPCIRIKDINYDSDEKPTYYAIDSLISITYLDEQTNQKDIDFGAVTFLDDELNFVETKFDFELQ
jgi:hypothetical protein